MQPTASEIFQKGRQYGSKLNMPFSHFLRQNKPCCSNPRLKYANEATDDKTKQCTHFFYYKHTGKLGLSSICLRFSQFEPEIMLKVCLISKLISWSDIAFDMNTAMVSFKCLNLNIRLGLT